MAHREQDLFLRQSFEFLRSPWAQLLAWRLRLWWFTHGGQGADGVHAGHWSPTGGGLTVRMGSRYLDIDIRIHGGQSGESIKEVQDEDPGQKHFLVDLINRDHDKAEL